MDHLVYVAASGPRTSIWRRPINAHNLANASTVGFKADLPRRRACTSSARARRPAPTTWSAPGHVDFARGMLEQTGRELDWPSTDRGWFAVQARGGGEGCHPARRFARRRVRPAGQWRRRGAAGQRRTDRPAAVQLPEHRYDGTVSIVPLGAQPNAVAVLDRIKLVNPPQESLRKNDYGLMQAGDGLPVEAGRQPAPGHRCAGGQQRQSVGAWCA
jgi:flagellar basal-body rod protein FlgF